MVPPTNFQTIQNQINEAVTLHQQGDLTKAEKAYRSILKFHPQLFDVSHLLGVVYLQQGDAKKAIKQIRSALQLKPDNTAAHSNLGNALFNLRRVDEALACYSKALALEPGFVDAAFNAGIASIELRQFEKALSYLDKVVALKPEHADAFFYRGSALKALGRFDEALASYDGVIALQPGHAQAHLNRGNILRGLKRFAEALEAVEKAIALRPKFAEALLSKGNLLADVQRYEEALDSYEKAIECKPDYAEAFNNQGNILQFLNRNDEAVKCFERAIALKPDYAEAYGNLGSLQLNLKRFEGAIACCDKALSIDPDHRFMEGMRLYAKMFLCDWRDYDAQVQSILAKVREGKLAATPFSLICIPSTAEDQLRCNRAYAAAKHPPVAPLWNGERYQHGKIRLAYLSADFHEHATAYLMAGLFEEHDRSRFEITAFSFGKDDRSKIRERLACSFDNFVDVSSLPDKQVAQMVREREIDIAVDLKGFTQNNRAGIFAFRSAPVQVNYLGYPSTMGVDYIDYIIADRTIIPLEMERYHSEKVVCLPNTYQPNDRKRAISGATPSRAALGLPESGFVFCCFNNTYKIAPDVFDVWMKLLKTVDGSVLWLLQSTGAAAVNLRREVEQRGVAPNRIVFAPHIKLEDHLARYRQADLFLDTLPCNAHTTASDALWAGLPVLTCLGQTFAGRVAASLLNAVGAPELITESLDEYEEMARRLAREPQSLDTIKAKLAASRDNCALFDTKRYARHLESAYIRMSENVSSPLGL